MIYVRSNLILTLDSELKLYGKKGPEEYCCFCDYCNQDIHVSEHKTFDDVCKYLFSEKWALIYGKIFCPMCVEDKSYEKVKTSRYII